MSDGGVPGGSRGCATVVSGLRGGVVGRSYIETFFRHRVLLMLPLVLGFLVGTVFAFIQPREFKAISSVWIDTPVPAGSSVGSGGNTPPSTGQSVLLTQYLATRTFLTAVAENSPVSEKFKQAGPDEADAILAKLAKSVSVSTPGPQLMTVSVTTKSASEATGTAEALLAQFERFQITDMHRQTQSQADYDKSQLDSAAAALKEAEHKLDKVRGSSSGRAKDPAAAAAVAAVELAQKAYADAATAYGKSSRALAASESTGLRVLDKPDRAWPQAREDPADHGCGRRHDGRRHAQPAGSAGAHGPRQDRSGRAGRRSGPFPRRRGRCATHQARGSRRRCPHPARRLPSPGPRRVGHHREHRATTDRPGWLADSTMVTEPSVGS